MKKAVISAMTVALILFAQSVIAQQEIGNKQVAGSWIGKIDAGSISLRVIFNLSLTGNDSLAATLDSPDQGVKNIKIGPVFITGNSIKIQAPIVVGIYEGTITNDTLITGTWKQAGRSTDLNLSKLKTAFSIVRPQEPKPPFPYAEKEVTFVNSTAGITLSGTLTIPEGNGPFPAAILLTGSGAQNRNEELMGHKPFMVIADWLTRNGIAVLRYDDRGVGKSQGNYIASTTADLSTDAMAAFMFLKNADNIDHEKTGYIGHSEGGLIAPIAASENSDVAFIVSLAGPGVSGEQIILTQMADISRKSGMSENQIKESVETNRKLFSVLKKEKDNNIASSKMIETYRKILDKKKLSPEEAEKELKTVQASLNPSTLIWMRYFIKTDPAYFWKKVKCPVLALNGENDLQVSAEENLKNIKKALVSGNNTAVTTLQLPELNHLFQHSKTGLPAEYSGIEETFSPEALLIISNWIKDQTSGKH